MLAQESLEPLGIVFAHSRCADPYKETCRHGRIRDAQLGHCTNTVDLHHDTNMKNLGLGNDLDDVDLDLDLGFT